MPFRLSKSARLALIVLGVLWFTHRTLIEIVIDWMWFDAVGFIEVFEKSLGARIALFAAGSLVAGLFIRLNVSRALRAAPLDPRAFQSVSGEMLVDPRQVLGLIRLVGWVVTLLPAFVFGMVASSLWLEVLSFVERIPFGTTDPVFGFDVAFYVFELPLIAYARGIASGIVVVTTIACGIYYLFHQSTMGRSQMPISDAGRKHMLVLAGILFALTAVGWWLDRYDLLFSREGAVWGVGYTDEHARIPAFGMMAAISLGVAVMLVSSLNEVTLKRPVTALGFYFLARILLSSAWPNVVQEYNVKPNELGMESAYLERNIASTREAYALDRIEVKPFDASDALTMDAIDANPKTVENIRVWDDRPLLTTLRQLQEIRPYYDFADVDVDRYTIDGRLRQVMLSARELNYDNVPANAKSWFNEHLQYTHGYGLTMSPVNVVTPEGLPDLFIQDIPPESKVGMDIERPEVYYGELTDRFVLVNTEANEFDFPNGDQNAYTKYAGDGGVPIGTTLRKALFSLYYQSLDILMSDYVSGDSKIMFRRRVKERVSEIAPFLQLDRDPYLVVSEGRMYWMLDAYTVTDRYPYAEHFLLPRKRINYIRNSVKVVMDVYHGSVDFYVADSEDPLINVYGRIFPKAFKPISEMPEGLRPHVRYPVDFFDIQAAMYRAYHMTDPTVFYNKEDMWEAPKELFGSKEQLMQSYYLIMKLPDEEDEEFILLVPFVPTNKDNMISWLAARCDPENYGRLVLFQFPKQRLIYGPSQIEARIDQTPEISEQLTLWSQAGSRVIRGNLLVIPVEDALMYVEAVYLQAESSQLPELKRVIVSYENAIAMEPTLDMALRKVFGAKSVARALSDVASGDDDGSSISGKPAVRAWQSLASDAQLLFDGAIEAQKSGDWSAYGAQLNALESALQSLMEAAKGTDQASARGQADTKSE